MKSKLSILTFLINFLMFVCYEIRTYKKLIELFNMKFHFKMFQCTEMAGHLLFWAFFYAGYLPCGRGCLNAICVHKQ